MTDIYSFYPPIDLPIAGSGDFDPPVSFSDTEDRLVEAMLTCWRFPDRERGWQRLRCAWPEITRDVLAGDYPDTDAQDAPVRMASQTRQDIAEMEEAFGWLDAVVPADRRLIGMAIVQLAAGKREIGWIAMLDALGLTRGADALRKRYGRALAAICAFRNGGNPRADVSTG